MNFVLTFLLWLFLNIMIGLTMDFALFTQTTPEMKDANIFAKILSSEFWASIEWMFLGTKGCAIKDTALAKRSHDEMSQLRVEEDGPGNGLAVTRRQGNQIETRHHNGKPQRVTE
jgi:hypothetical protein